MSYSEANDGIQPPYEPSPAYRNEPPAGYRPPPAPSRLPMLLVIMAAVAFVLALPYGVEQYSYARKRGELRARSEAADDELGKLGDGAKLVPLSDTARVFRAVAMRVEPSVVHINTEQVKIAKVDEPQDEWGLGVPYGRGERMRGQGSGVIIDAAQGYVVTNYHVIQGAAALNVTLADGRQIDDVTVVGYDVLTDLAVLKLASDKLTAAEWGDSDALEPGDWVLAVGNPYGLDRSVTSGIISAKERRGVARGSPYQDFLQTDAAVNPGNSGGPLVDLHGQVIGINTAIVGKAFQGISFAIPSRTVREVVEKLIAGGRVARGWLGVGLDNLTPEVAEKLGLKETGGVLVTRVLANSPAALGGLRPGDVILQWNDKPVTDSVEMTLEIGRTAIGSQIELVVLREGNPRKVTITIGQRPEEGRLRP
jgi:serine protease Do